jgi:hypothetical protein
VTSFAGSTDLSFLKAGGEATFKLVSHLIDRISIPRETGTIVHASNVLDCFSQKAAQKRIRHRADQKFDSCIAQLDEIRFIHVSVDSGIIQFYPKEDYSGLFKSIVMRLMAKQRSAAYQDPSRTRVVINAFLIDNLRSQSTGNDLFLSNYPEYAAILHIRCFRHMLNLVVSTRRDGGTLARITDVTPRIFIGNKSSNIGGQALARSRRRARVSLGTSRHRKF